MAGSHRYNTEPDLITLKNSLPEYLQVVSAGTVQESMGSTQLEVQIQLAH